ncbi:hypothetical protein ACJX0J_019484 [Zea mays]
MCNLNLTETQKNWKLKFLHCIVHVLIGIKNSVVHALKIFITYKTREEKLTAFFTIHLIHAMHLYELAMIEVSIYGRFFDALYRINSFVVALHFRMLFAIQN